MNEAGEKRKAPAQWFRLHAGDFLVRTSRLNPFEAGIFIRLLAQMHEADGPLSDDLERLARACHVTKQSSLAAALDALITKGLIERRGDRLWADMAQSEENSRHVCC